MKMLSLKNTFWPALVVFTVLAVFFVNTPPANALFCMPPDKKIHVAAYEQGNLVDGFGIEEKLVEDDSCKRRPVVRNDADNLEALFSSASEELNQPLTTGVYQLETKLCFPGSQDCSDTPTLEQLSSSPTDLTQVKTQWQQKERNAIILANIKSWLGPVILVIAVALALTWPWILIKKWPHLRKRLSLLLVVAIVLQALLALFLNYLKGLPAHWQWTTLLLLLALVVSIVVEIIVLAIGIVRSRSDVG